MRGLQTLGRNRQCRQRFPGVGLGVDFLAFRRSVVHEAADERLVNVGVLESPTIGVAVTVRRRAERLADREPDTLAGGGVGLVVLA